jgi:hypothetical protein
MKSHWFPTALTVVNLILLVFMVTRVEPVIADGPAGVLKGRELQIVDDLGKVRASIKLHPADPKQKAADGKLGTADTVMLRLVDPNGRPIVKLGGSVESAGFMLAGGPEQRDWNGIQLLADDKKSSVVLTNRDGRKTTLAP